MQETSNNDFGLKKRNTTISQAKIGKHECCTKTAMCGDTRVFLFSSDEESCYVFSNRNNCCEFPASYSVNLSSVH